MALDPQVLQDLLRTARQRGATAGDALLVDNASFEVQVRLREVEKVQQSHQKRLGLRLFFGQRSATTSTSDLSEVSLRQLLDDTCALAQAMAADPQAGLPAPEETITTIPDLVLWDDAIAQLPVEERTAMAREAERAALDYDSRITKSEGGEYSSSQSHVLYANSQGWQHAERLLVCHRTQTQSAPGASGHRPGGSAAGTTTPGGPESGDAESARGLRSVHGCQSAGPCVLGSVRLGSVPWGVVSTQLPGHAYRP
jgi:PmbA protein